MVPMVNSTGSRPPSFHDAASRLLFSMAYRRTDVVVIFERRLPGKFGAPNGFGMSNLEG